MLRIVASLERVWPASRMLIHMEADKVVELLAIHMEPGCSATAALTLARVPPRLGRKVLRILEWTPVGTSWHLLIS
jgi:hypothetical protein